MVTNSNPVCASIDSGYDLRGLSTDEKPTNVPNGSTFIEMDTGDVYMYDAAGATWRKL